MVSEQANAYSDTQTTHTTCRIHCAPSAELPIVRCILFWTQQTQRQSVVCQVQVKSDVQFEVHKQFKRIENKRQSFPKEKYLLHQRINDQIRQICDDRKKNSCEKYVNRIEWLLNGKDQKNRERYSRSLALSFRCQTQNSRHTKKSASSSTFSSQPTPFDRAQSSAFAYSFFN